MYRKFVFSQLNFIIYKSFIIIQIIFILKINIFIIKLEQSLILYLMT